MDETLFPYYNEIKLVNIISSHLKCAVYSGEKR